MSSTKALWYSSTACSPRSPKARRVRENGPGGLFRALADLAQDVRPQLVDFGVGPELGKAGIQALAQGRQRWILACVSRVAAFDAVVVGLRVEEVRVDQARKKHPDQETQLELTQGRMGLVAHWEPKPIRQFDLTAPDIVELGRVSRNAVDQRGALTLASSVGQAGVMAGNAVRQQVGPIRS